MEWENRTALDIILAEKGGMCPVWGWMLHIHPPKHSSGWDHNQGFLRSDSPEKWTA
jgi:hypothetical protein